MTISKKKKFYIPVIVMAVILVSVGFSTANNQSNSEKELVYMNCPETIIPDYPDYPSCPDCICEPEPNNIQGCHLPEKYFKLKQYDLTITGYSMQPTLFKGNNLKAVKFEDWMLNDLEGCIILFDVEGTKVIHRVKGVYENHVITQGDNLNYDDGKIPIKDIEYVLTGVEFT